MTSRDAAAPTGPFALATPSGDPFLEAKLHLPSSRKDWVGRDRLLQQMRRAAQIPVVLVAAPAGYGKTILGAQWLALEGGPPAAWVCLDSGDNDPYRLWGHVAAALARAGCVPPASQPDRAVGITDSDAPDGLLPAIFHALAAMPEDIVLVLDDFHLIQERACHDQVELLIASLPPQAHLVIITRSDPGLRLGRLRASRRLAEIRAADLSFTEEEAAALLAHEGVRLSAAAVSELIQGTEGWPAALYLAALSLVGRPDPEEFVRGFSGGNRFVGDYLAEEVLSRLPEQLRDFITTISILDRFSASLCDHVADISSSATLLRDLERNNLFLIPLDEERTWFRFHHLFAAVARSELEITRPEHVNALRRRASDWFRDHGYVDNAVFHSLAAGDNEGAGVLVQTHWLRYVDAGRTATVLGWIESIGTSTQASDPAARVTAAWTAALIGDEKALTDHVVALEAFRSHGPLPDGSVSVDSALCMIQGLFGYGGPVEMMAGSKRAVALETDPHSPFHAIANLALGHAAYVAGDLDQAIARLTRTLGNDSAPAIIRALSLSTKSLVEAERGEPVRSRESAEKAMDIVETKGLRAMPQASMAYTALGQSQAAAGKLDDALVTLERGLALRRERLADEPWCMIHHLLVTARIAAEAGRQPLARELLSELDLRLSPYTDGTTAMHARVAAVHQLVRADHVSDAYLEPLTPRELHILRLMQGTMSHQQIASELYLSFNTVKTHTRAVYRKLGVHTRSEAVRTGRQKRLI